MVAGTLRGPDGLFVHPVQDERVMAGNGTIGLELAEELPDADAVLVPWGGGGLFTGIASALRAGARDPGLRRPAGDRRRGQRGLAAGEPSEAPGFAPSFVDGAGARSCCRRCGSGRGRCSPARRRSRSTRPAAAVRLLAERARVVAEGAGALALAAALSGRIAGRRLVCIVSGGNIDADRLAAILRGETPA